MREDFKPGYQYHVNCNVSIKGELVLPPDKGQTQSAKIDVTGQSKIKYDERVLELTKDGRIDRTVRYYQQMDFERLAGKNDQRGSLRPEVRKLVILRHNHVEVPFCPDSNRPLLWDEIDMVRTDVFTPALQGLLPVSAVRSGDSWNADLTAVQELTDLEKITKGNLTCRFGGVQEIEGGKFARVSFRGKVDGVNEDGPAQHELDGYLLFDVASNHLSYLSMEGTQYLLDKNGTPSGGRIRGTMVMKRDAAPATKELSDQALRYATLEPNEQNTRLLFSSPEVGVAFLYPRHWHVAGVNSDKRQVGLDTKRGSGMLISIDGLAKIPNGDKFQKEVAGQLARQNARVLKMDSPRLLSPGLEGFTVEADISGERVYLHYFIARQKGGGAVLTANLKAAERATIQPDVERIAHSLVVLPPTK
jgi:hypothetical protein